MKTLKRTTTCLLGLTWFFLAAPSAFGKSKIEDRKLEMEIKKAAPLNVVDRRHGQMRLTRNGSFALVGKGRFGVAGSWKVENAQLILQWQNSDDTLKASVKNEKDGLRLDGQTKDARGEYNLNSSHQPNVAAAVETSADTGSESGE